MDKTLIALAILLLATTAEVLPGSDYLVPLKGRLDVVAVQPSSADLAGKYAKPGPDLKKRIVALSGDDLYLFPDGTYVYTEWADILPETVFDRGRWAAIGGLLKLQSNAAVTWKTTNEKQFVIVRYDRRPDHLFLLGIDRELGYLREHIGDDPDFMFLITTLAFAQSFSGSEWRATRSAVLRRAWNPRFFRHE